MGITLKSRHADGLERIARQTGKDPSEVLGHLVNRAHSEVFGQPIDADDGSTPQTAPPSPPMFANAPGENQEPITHADAKKLMTDRDADAEAENEGDDAPPDQMKGPKPNPLGLHAWAARGTGGGGSTTGGGTPSVDAKQAKKDRLKRKYPGAKK